MSAATYCVWHASHQRCARLQVPPYVAKQWREALAAAEADQTLVAGENGALLATLTLEEVGGAPSRTAALGAACWLQWRVETDTVVADCGRRATPQRCR